jgi:hypothetical protein
MTTRKDRCRSKLIEVAAARALIEFSDLAAYLGMIPRGPWEKMLDEIYEEERKAGRPDLTLVAVYAPPKRHPPYLSLGGPTRSVEYEKKNPEHCTAWQTELEEVCKTWAMQRKP